MLAEKDLSDEHSAFYQMFSTYLNRQRHKYHADKKRRVAARAQATDSQPDNGLMFGDL